MPWASSARGPWVGAARLSWHVTLLHGPCPACNHLLISVLCDHSSVSSLEGSGKLIFRLLAAFHRPCSTGIWMSCITLYQYDAGSCHFTANNCPKLQIYSGEMSAIALRLWYNQWAHRVQPCEEHLGFYCWSIETAFNSAGFIAESWHKPNSGGQKLSDCGHLEPLLPDGAC